MENRNNFNLRDSIKNWKIKLLENPNMTSDNVEELESHLFDEILTLKKIGLNEEEALIISLKRIGNTNMLTSEYSKVNHKESFINRIIPHLTGMLLFLTFLTLTELFASLLSLCGIFMGLNEKYLGMITVGTVTSFMIIFYATIFYKYKNGGAELKSLVKIPVLILIILISNILTFISFPLLSRTIGMNGFGTMQGVLNIFKILFVAILLIFSIILFFQSKKQHKMKISE